MSQEDVPERLRELEESVSALDTEMTAAIESVAILTVRELWHDGEHDLTVYSVDVFEEASGLQVAAKDVETAMNVAKRSLARSLGLLMGFNADPKGNSWHSVTVPVMDPAHGQVVLMFQGQDGAPDHWTQEKQS